jgi:signal transduction histidine kinase
MAPTLEKSATAAKSSVRGEESPQSVIAPTGAQGGKDNSSIRRSEEAKAMLNRAVAAVKEDKTKALDMFNKGEGGFKDRDLYVFCANASDGTITAHPTNKGEPLQNITGKKGYPLGQEMMQNATEETIKEVTYWWPRPGSDKSLEKTSFYTKVGDQICGVGYYKG